jgi:hypothetical protein
VIEQKFTVVGTARNKKGVIKLRWTTDMITQYKRICSEGCTDINLHNIPEPMTKLETLEWLLKTKDLTEEEQEVIYIKKAEKSRQKRLKNKQAITE